MFSCSQCLYCRSGIWRGGKVLSFVGSWGPFFWALFVRIPFPSVAVCPCLLSTDQAQRRYFLLQPKGWMYSIYASVLSTYTSPLQFLMTETLSSGLEETVCCSHIYHRLTWLFPLLVKVLLEPQPCSSGKWIWECCTLSQHLVLEKHRK